MEFDDCEIETKPSEDTSDSLNVFQSDKRASKKDSDLATDPLVHVWEFTAGSRGKRRHREQCQSFSSKGSASRAGRKLQAGHWADRRADKCAVVFCIGRVLA